MKRIPILLAMLLAPLLANLSHARAEQKCEVVTSNARTVSLMEQLKAFLGSGSNAPPCASLAAVYNELTEERSEGGRGLETKKQFNPAAGQANLDAAMRDPETGKRLAKLKREVKDEKLRLYLEAAVLDEDGFDDARELLVRQLKQKLP